MKLLEKIVEFIAPKTHERIGRYLEDKRDLEYKKNEVYDILRQNGVKTEFESWLGSEDWKGNLKSYPITPKIGKPYFEDDMSRFCLVPVHYDRKAGGDEWNSLFLVNLRNKKVKEVANNGWRDIHYHGHLKYKPFSIKENEEKVTFAYSTKVRPRIADLFDGDFWYFLRVRWPVIYTNKTIQEVKIE